MSKDYEEIKRYCCEAFKQAQKEETDNEGYGRLIFHPYVYKPGGCLIETDEKGKYIQSEGEWATGDGLPSMNFCPWCGKNLKDV
jgi:hypothetical protein